MAIENEIYLHKALHDHKSSRRLLVFMITGNPGLIEYYRGFLTRLYALLQKRDGTLDVHVYGASLSGFEVNRRPPSKPLTLDDQIDSVTLRLLSKAKSISPAEKLPVVVIGHSVGSYMLLEIIARWQAMRKASDSPISIVGGVCLFPTVVDIAKSPTGRKATPFLKLPGFAVAVQIFAKLLFALLPLAWVARLVQLIAKLPGDGASVTAAFLKSPAGVHQALYMAKYEMLQITNDRWSDELWGGDAAVLEAVATAATARTGGPLDEAPQLFFYWGEDDHWVANETRDMLIRTRARLSDGQGAKKAGDQRPVMEVDRNGTPHGFCVREDQSELVAEKVAEYIDEVVGGL